MPKEYQVHTSVGERTILRSKLEELFREALPWIKRVVDRHGVAPVRLYYVLESEEDAALAYNVKASVVQGEFARLNLVELPYLGYQPQPRRKSSIYKGVCYLRREKRWRGYVDAAGKREVLGEFATEHEAASAVDRRLHA